MIHYMHKVLKTLGLTTSSASYLSDVN